MRLLLTRPIDQSEASAARLRDLGHELVLAPVSRIVTIPAIWPDGDFAGVLATSPRAFAAFGPPENKAVPPLFVVGTQTQAAARLWLGSGCEPAIQMAADAAHLVGILVSRPMSRWLYLAGRERKPHLEAALAAAGHEVETVETYAAQAMTVLAAAALSAIASGKLDAVLHYSRRSAEIFLELAEAAGHLENVRQLRHFCLSPDVAGPFRTMHAEIAAHPNENSLFALLEGNHFPGARTFSPPLMRD